MTYMHDNDNMSLHEKKGWMMTKTRAATIYNWLFLNDFFFFYFWSKNNSLAQITLNHRRRLCGLYDICISIQEQVTLLGIKKQERFTIIYPKFTMPVDKE